jgi:hypothetical protein
MGNVNRKASKGEMTSAYRAIKEAFPDCEPVFGGHGDYGGHRALRDHTISFRLRDAKGKLRSNVVWLDPDQLALLTPAGVRALVAHANGKSAKK